MRYASVTETLHDVDPTDSSRGFERIRDYQRRAQLHRPRDQDTLRVAVHELASRGLTPADIGQALGLNPSAIHTLLAGVSQ